MVTDAKIKNMNELEFAVLLSALQNSRGFHWMQRCNSFIIPRLIGWSGMEYLTCTV